MGYSIERRESVLKKMLPPNNLSIAALSKEEGISDATLYLWRKQAREQGRLMPDSDTTPNGWTSRDKFAAVMETAAMSETDVAAYCREKGIYPEQLAQWRVACEQANNWSEVSEKKLKEATQSERKKNKQLQKELDRKEKALAEAAALLVLRKKYNALFEDPEGEK
jgi:transposase-like protein